MRAPGQPIDLPGPEFISEIAYPAVTYNQPSKPTELAPERGLDAPG